MRTFKVTLGILFGLLITGIIFLAVIVYSENEESYHTSELVQNTYEVLDYVDDLASLCKNLQLENAELLTSGGTPSSFYEEARHAIPKKIKTAQQLISENPNQKIQFDSLQRLIKGLLTFTESTMNIYEKGIPLPESERKKIVRQNFLYRSGISHLVQSIKDEEMHLLEIQKADKEKSVMAFNKAFNFLILTLAVLLLSAFLVIRYNFNKRASIQDELEKANELFGKLFSESPAGIVISEIDSGVIIDCNKAYCDLVQFRRQELIGKSPDELGIINPKDHKEIIDGTRKLSHVYDLEIPIRTKGNIALWISKSIQIIRVKDRLCRLSVILNMTAHKEMEEKIKKALNTEVELNKMKSNFVSLASHEFRTPLTTILSSTFLLENYLEGEQKEKSLKHLARIKSSVNILTSVLDEFLSLTKIEEGKIKPLLVRVNIPDYLEKVCKDLSLLAKPGQRVLYNHAGEAEAVTDPVLLKNIVNNLLSNAIKYSSENSDIFVSTHVDAMVQLSVKDSGIGISTEDQPHLFTRFFRGSNASTIQGTGLGLHLMKHYLQMLNGSVSFKSELGKGSEFTVSFMSQPAQAV